MPEPELVPPGVVQRLPALLMPVRGRDTEEEFVELPLMVGEGGSVRDSSCSFSIVARQL